MCVRVSEQAPVGWEANLIKGYWWCWPACLFTAFIAKAHSVSCVFERVPIGRHKAWARQRRCNLPSHLLDINKEDLSIKRGVIYIKGSVMDNNFTSITVKTGSLESKVMWITSLPWFTFYHLFQEGKKLTPSFIWYIYPSLVCKSEIIFQKSGNLHLV